MTNDTVGLLNKILVTARNTITNLEKDNSNLRARILLLESRNNQLIREKEWAEQIVQNSLGKANETNNIYLEENNKLKAEIRALKEG